MWRLTHCPAGEEWSKDFMSKALLVDELRRHICSDCLAGSPDFLDNIVDTADAKCRDLGVLLCTPCGCEYEAEELVDGHR